MLFKGGNKFKTHQLFILNNILLRLPSKKVLLLLKSYTPLYLLIDLCNPSHFLEYINVLKLCKLLIHTKLIGLLENPDSARPQK